MQLNLDLIRRQERTWERLAPYIVNDPNSYWHGSTEVTKSNVTDLLVVAIPLYCHPESVHYRDSLMLERIEGACRQLRRRQLASGCISLLNCNIDSPPDTAFAVHTIATAYKALKQANIPEAAEAMGLLLGFLENSRECLATGGIHTPNHRWVMCGALAMLYELFPEERLKLRAYQYLGEGFDMTDYGEWTERSNASYNPHCDLSLYHVYRVFGHVPSLEAARLNLNMMKYFLHPDGSIVTEYSSRQDRGTVVKMNAEYEIVSRLMASETGDAQFAAMACLAAQSDGRPGPQLMYWLAFPEQMAMDGVESSELPAAYTKLFDSGRAIRVPKANGTTEGFGPMHGAAVLRHRQGPLSMTVMAGQPDFLYIQYGEARLVGLRLVAGYFGLGGVSFPRIEQVADHTYRLQVELEWGYTGPLPEELAAPSGGYFVDMPNHLRELTHVCRLPVIIDMTIGEREIRLDVELSDVPHLIVQLAAAFDGTGAIVGEGVVERRTNLYQLRQGDAVFRQGNDWIALGSGAHEHEYDVVRGDSMDYERNNVTINWMGPVKRTVTITCGSGEAGGEG